METIHHNQNSMEKYPMLILSQEHRISLMLYSEDDNELVERLKRAHSTFSLDDFLSLSENRGSFGV